MRRWSGVFMFLMFVASVLYAGAQAKTQKPAEKKPAPAAARGNVAKGKVVYANYCDVCHYSANTSKKIGPGLKGIYKRGKFADGKKVDDTTMREWIIKGGVDMPSFDGQLNDEQIKDLIAYLRTL